MAPASAANAAYAASKGAVFSLTKIALLQLAQHNITICAICPGVTRTALSEANLRVRARQEHVTVERWHGGATKRSPAGAPTTPRVSPPWQCFGLLLERATSLGNRSMLMVASLSTDWSFAKKNDRDIFSLSVRVPGT
jgi:NAD(P)-dependent dehydrogenase (short-subunit alcohol dehydrogenase family)